MATRRRLNPGKGRHFLKSGAPNAGGKMYFYEVGGNTTPKDTYVSQTGVANENPVILDDDGYEPEIFVEDLYYVEIKDKNDVLQSYADYVTSTPLGNITSGANAPTSTPINEGDVYIDTTNNLAYISVGTASSSDWVKTTGGTASGDVTKVGTPLDDQVGVWTGDGTIEGTTGLTHTSTALTTTADIVLAEKADHSSTPGAGFGYLWVKNTAPATIMFTDDAGTDFNLASAGAGDVAKVGTPVDDQVGVWTGDGTIEGTAGLTYSSTALSTGADFVMTEKADHSSTPTAGFGYLWTKNTSPSSLIFTNDAGADIVLDTDLGETTGVEVVTITATTGTITLDSSFDTLGWVQQGSMVNLGGWLKCTSISSPTGTLTISPVPTCSNLTEGAGARRVFIPCTEMNPAMDGSLVGLIDEGATTLEIWNQVGGSLISAASLFSNTSELWISMTYSTSD